MWRRSQGAKLLQAWRESAFVDSCCRRNLPGYPSCQSIPGRARLTLGELTGDAYASALPAQLSGDGGVCTNEGESCPRKGVQDEPANSCVRFICGSHCRAGSAGGEPGQSLPGDLKSTSGRHDHHQQHAAGQAAGGAGGNRKSGAANFS